MKIVKIDPSLCICCGTCAAIAEHLFEMSASEGVAVVKVDQGKLASPEDEDLASECATACPAGAILVQDAE